MEDKKLSRLKDSSNSPSNTQKSGLSKETKPRLLGNAFNNAMIQKTALEQRSLSREKEKEKPVLLARPTEKEEEEDEEEGDEEEKDAKPDDDILGMNPKSITTVKLAFEKRLKERKSVRNYSQSPTMP
jgi:CRISPR/Cas system-associated endonuclease Cas3-HD